MEMSPQTVRSTSFSVVKRGYDPDEVDAFKEQVAAAVEFSQHQATAMEARARAAVAKLQEVSQQVADAQRGAAAPAAAAPAPAPAAEAAPSADAEVISRTLLLAQRTADHAVAEARLEADQVLQTAHDEAARILEQATVTAARAVDEARAESRRAGDQERLIAENEVQALLARRDFLLADVEQLEQYVQSQRERLRDAANSLFDLVDRVPAGLADMRRPLLSASAAAIDPAVAAAIEAVASAPQAAPQPPAAPEASAPSGPTPTEPTWQPTDPTAAAPQAAQPSFDDLADTGELPVVQHDQFRIGGEELQ